MPKHKCPYAFTARSRADMMAAIFKGRSSYDRFLFNWNVKAHNVNWESPKGEYELDSALDDAWAEYLESNADHVTQWAFDDASSYYHEGLYTTWPGDDQGQWELEFHGRQGGHLCLAAWSGMRFRGMDEYDCREWLDGCDFATVRAFYRAMVCMDSDFTSAKASSNVEYQANFIRGQWEEERREETEARNLAAAESIVESRPDMCPAGLTQYGETAI